MHRPERGSGGAGQFTSTIFPRAWRLVRGWGLGERERRRDRHPQPALPGELDRGTQVVTIQGRRNGAEDSPGSCVSAYAAEEGAARGRATNEFTGEEGTRA